MLNNLTWESDLLKRILDVHSFVQNGRRAMKRSRTTLWRSRHKLKKQEEGQQTSPNKDISQPKDIDVNTEELFSEAGNNVAGIFENPIPDPPHPVTADPNNFRPLFLGSKLTLEESEICPLKLALRHRLSGVVKMNHSF
eukprot:Pompholyxophrys_punicea_v1_NODE_304_length_2319_cov_4.614841.p2 type:complete len:139 gc:universal NODE_304_length_2319_cov_4.614841:2224-1808(-)